MRGRSPRRCAERRGPRADAAEAVVEVLAELAARDHRAQVAVGGADDAHVGADRRWTPPTRSKVRSWSTRSSATCVRGEMSPISSRKSVPPSASSKRPRRRAAAPVNAPFSWPKSSERRSVSTSAAQLTLTSGPARAALAAWIASATSSLPVPLSPRMRTVLFERATLRTAARRPRMAGSSPTISRGATVRGAPSATERGCFFVESRSARCRSPGPRRAAPAGERGRDRRLREERGAHVGRERVGDLIAERECLIEMRARGAPCRRAYGRARREARASRGGALLRRDAGERRALRGQRQATSPMASPRARAERLEERDLGASFVGRAQLAGELDRFAARATSPSSSAMRAARRWASAEVLLVLADAGVDDGLCDLAPCVDVLPRRERDARRRRSRSRSSAAGGMPGPSVRRPKATRVLRVIEEAELRAQLRDVGQDAGGGEAVAAARWRSLSVRSESAARRVLVAPGGDDREVVEREGAGARIARALAVGEDVPRRCERASSTRPFERRAMPRFRRARSSAVASPCGATRSARPRRSGGRRRPTSPRRGAACRACSARAGS